MSSNTGNVQKDIGDLYKDDISRIMERGALLKKFVEEKLKKEQMKQNIKSIKDSLKSLQKLEERWNENTGISWWNESRKKLNVIIDFYNEWQTKHLFNEKRAHILLTKIKKGKDTIGSIDGGSGYWDKLDEMEKFVKSCIN